jgi:hypothetical protein
MIKKEDIGIGFAITALDACIKVCKDVGRYSSKLNKYCEHPQKSRCTALESGKILLLISHNSRVPW